MSRELNELSREEYEALKDCGMLWEFFPEATGTYTRDLVTKVKYFKAAQDDNVNEVVRSYLDRAETGMLKYGVTTGDNPLSLLEWLDHAQQELMDATIYLERVKQEIRQ